MAKCAETRNAHSHTSPPILSDFLNVISSPSCR